MAARVSGGGPEEMRRLAARLKTADQVLRRQLRKALTEAADPVTGAVREAIQGSPSKHDGTLRGEAARTVSSSVSLAGGRVTLAIVSRGSLMPGGKEDLPAYLNGRGWRHPVYGRRTVFQASHAAGWFSQTISDRAGDLRDAVESAMGETARKLEGGP